MLPPGPPPLSELERRVLEADPDHSLGFDEACENVPRWLRAEVDRRLREAARWDPVEITCVGCGEPVDVSRGQAEPVEAACFVEQLGDSAKELAGAFAALR